MSERFQNLVTLKHPDFKTQLTLGRVPQFLRFVTSRTRCGRLAWDALDQLDDEPQPEETVIAAVFSYEGGTMHMDRVVDGRRRGEWYRTFGYVVIPQEMAPDEATLRDAEKWQAWCHAQNYEAVRLRARSET